MKRTYDHQWATLSRRFLRRNPVCEVAGCGKPSQHADHIVTVRAAPHRRLDATNLQALCHACHNRLTAAYDRGRLSGACDVAGMPLDPGHPWAQPDNATAIRAANRPPASDPRLAARLKRAAVQGRASR
jgi:hypothetical protein